MQTYIKVLPIAAIGAMLLTGCVTEQNTPSKMSQLQCDLPKIDVITDSVNKATQAKGGLDITVVPALYKSVRVDDVEIKSIQPGFTDLLLLSEKDRQNKVFVEQITTPLLKSEPGRVEFTVKIHNQLNRVFHGQGAVVQINVDGKLIPFNNTDYKEFSGGIVPPLNDADLKVYGPPLDVLKDKGTISIFLYDVVTATDVAGNTTEKQNYTWDFAYTKQTVTGTGEFKKGQGWISLDTYEKFQAEKQKMLMNPFTQNP